MDKNYYEGIACVLCSKQEQSECPVKTASPWSKYYNFCNEYESLKTGDSIIDVLAKKLRGISIEQ